MVVGRILEIRNDRPGHYWVRLLCFAFSIVFLAMWLTSDNAHGDTPAGDEQEIASGLGFCGYGNSDSVFCRQLNGTLWVFSVTRDLGDSTLRTLYGYFSSDNGTTWSKVEISDSEDPGYEADGYPVKTTAAHVLTNNSIILAMVTYNYWGSSSKTEFTYLCHWNNSDLSQWEFVQGYAHTTYSALYCGSGLNETDKLMFSYRRYSSNNQEIKSFDPATRAVAWVGAVSNKYAQSPPGEPRCWLFWNISDEWNLIFTYEPGTGKLIYCYDVWDTTYPVWTKPILAIGSHIWDIVLTGNGTYVWISMYTSGSTRFYWPYLNWYSPEDDLGGTNIKIHADSYWGHFQLGLSNYDDCFVTAVGWNYNTDRAGAWGAKYYRNAATWQGTYMDYFQEDNDFANTWQYNFAADMPYQLYPRLESNYTQLPATLGFPNVNFVEYDTGDSAHDLWVDYNTTWPGILGWTYFPPEEGPDPGPGDGNQTVSDWLWWGDAGCISAVTIVAVVLLVGIIFVQATTRR